MLARALFLTLFFPISALRVAEENVDAVNSTLRVTENDQAGKIMQTVAKKAAEVIKEAEAEAARAASKQMILDAQVEAVHQQARKLGRQIATEIMAFREQGKSISDYIHAVWGHHDQKDGANVELRQKEIPSTQDMQDLMNSMLAMSWKMPATFVTFEDDFSDIVDEAMNHMHHSSTSTNGGALALARYLLDMNICLWDAFDTRFDDFLTSYDLHWNLHQWIGQVSVCLEEHGQAPLSHTWPIESSNSGGWSYMYYY